MDWRPLSVLPTVQVAELPAFTDDRGSLIEFWRKDELRFQSSTYKPAMGYLSLTKPGQIRGPHEHAEQTDLFVFAGPGAFELYLFSYLKHPNTGEIMPETRWNMSVGDPEAGPEGCAPLAVLVPPGIIHGYKCISEVAGLVINIPSRLYKGPQKKSDVDETRHENDPDSPFKIE